MFILYENEPYFYDAENKKAYPCNITPEGISCNFKSPMKALNDIKCGYTHGEIEALLADRIASAEEMPKPTRNKKAKSDIDE